VSDTADEIERIRAEQECVMVPKEPTEEMITALNSWAQCEGYIEKGYAAMLAAAPKPNAFTEEYLRINRAAHYAREGALAEVILSGADMSDLLAALEVGGKLSQENDKLKAERDQLLVCLQASVDVLHKLEGVEIEYPVAIALAEYGQRARALIDKVCK
jgi:hypothetical protein